MPVVKTQDMINALREAEENRRRLDSCKRHDFAGIPGTEVALTDVVTLYSTYACTKCRGTVSQNEQYWYNKGKEHGPETELERTLAREAKNPPPWG